MVPTRERWAGFGRVSPRQATVFPRAFHGPFVLVLVEDPCCCGRSSGSQVVQKGVLLASRLVFTESLAREGAEGRGGAEVLMG